MDFFIWLIWIGYLKELSWNLKALRLMSGKKISTKCILHDQFGNLRSKSFYHWTSKVFWSGLTGPKITPLFQHMFDRIVRTLDGNTYMVNESKGIVSVALLLSLWYSCAMALYVTRPRRDEEGIGRGLPSVPSCHSDHLAFFRRTLETSLEEVGRRQGDPNAFVLANRKASETKLGNQRVTGNCKWR